MHCSAGLGHETKMNQARIASVMGLVIDCQKPKFFLRRTLMSLCVADLNSEKFSWVALQLHAGETCF